MSKTWSSERWRGIGINDKPGTDSKRHDVQALITPHLQLLPLSRTQLSALERGPEHLEALLGLSISRDILAHPVLRAISMKLQNMARAPESRHSWYTYWLIIVAADSFGAGLAGFKGQPNALGQVEIGYGIDSAYRQRGYATEAAYALLEWAWQQPDCQIVAAWTARDNAASQRVLQKIGMCPKRVTGDKIYWQIERPD